MKDVRLYGTSIEKQIITSIADYKSQQWFDMGYQLGEAGSLVFFGKPAQQLIRTTRLVQGISSKFGGKFNLEALLACIGEEDKAALAFDAAFQQLEQAYADKNLEEVIPAVILTIAAYQQAK